MISAREAYELTEKAEVKDKKDRQNELIQKIDNRIRHAASVCRTYTYFDCGYVNEDRDFFRSQILEPAITRLQVAGFSIEVKDKPAMEVFSLYISWGHWSVEIDKR